MTQLKFCFLALVAVASIAGSSRAMDPFAFQYGYAMGYQYSFRNRLPTPPYFAIYPPVYYGQRYERPYGDSPFAAFSQLRSAPDYYPVPKETPFRTRSIVNPHVDDVLQPSHRVSGEPVAEAPRRIGKTVEVINPYAHEQYASRGR